MRQTSPDLPTFAYPVPPQVHNPNVHPVSNPNLDPHNPNQQPFNRFDMAPVADLKTVVNARLLKEVSPVVGDQEVDGVFRQGGTKGAEQYLAELRAQAKDAILTKGLRAHVEGNAAHFRDQNELDEFTPLLNAAIHEVRSKLTTMTEAQVLRESQRADMNPGYKALVENRMNEIINARARQHAAQQPRITNANVPNAVNPANHPGQPTQPQRPQPRRQHPPQSPQPQSRPAPRQTGNVLPQGPNAHTTQQINPNINPGAHPNAQPHSPNTLPTNPNTQGTNPNAAPPFQRVRQPKPTASRQMKGNLVPQPPTHQINPNVLAPVPQPNQAPASTFTPQNFNALAQSRGGGKKGITEAARMLTDEDLQNVIDMADADRKRRVYGERFTEVRTASAREIAKLNKQLEKARRANDPGRQQELQTKIVERQKATQEAYDRSVADANALPQAPNSAFKIGSKEMTALISERAHRANAKRRIEKEFKHVAAARKNLNDAQLGGMFPDRINKLQAIADNEYRNFLGIAPDTRSRWEKLRGEPSNNTSLKGMNAYDRREYSRMVMATLDPRIAFADTRHAKKVYSRLTGRFKKDFSDAYVAHWTAQGMSAVSLDR